MKVFRLAFFLPLLMLLSPLPAQAQLRATDLSNPPPISIPQGVTRDAARDAITQALFGRNWTIAEESGNSMVADLHVRSHWAQISIEIEGNQVQIRYRDSRNLHYSVQGSREVIHKNYLAWVDNLVGDIRTRLAQAQHRSR